MYLKKALIVLLLSLCVCLSLNVAVVPAPKNSSLVTLSRLTTYLTHRKHNTAIFVPEEKLIECVKLYGRTSCVAIRSDERINQDENLLLTCESKGFSQSLANSIAPFNPDIILLDYRMLCAEAVADHLGTPSVVFLPELLSNDKPFSYIEKIFGGKTKVFQNIFDASRAQFNLTPLKLERLFHSKHVITQTISGFDHSRPIPPNVHPVGFIMPEPRQRKKALVPGAFDQWMNDCIKGIIFVDLNNGISSTVKNQIEDALWKLAEDKMCVLWKTKDNRTEKATLPNFKVVETFPFSLDRVLRHNNTKVFLSHCGRTTTLEAIEGGTALIGFPTDQKQLTTCSLVQKRGVGVVLSTTNLQSNQIYEQVGQLVKNYHIQSNIRKFRRLGYIMGGAQRAAEIIEFAARQGRGAEFKAFGKLYHTSSFFNTNIGIVVVFSFLTALVIIVIRASHKFFSTKRKIE